MYKITVEQSNQEPTEKYPSFSTIYEQKVDELQIVDIINAVNKQKHD